MLIRHIGHAEFEIETESGVRIVTDPYDATCGYPIQRIRADIALVSHGHHDHNAVENLEGLQTVIDRAGAYTPSPEIHVDAIRGYHDDAKGAQRGETLLFRIETEGLRIVHLGDLGCEPDNEQIQKLKNPDILMIPVGGFFTIDGRTAARVAKQLNACVILPMHYKTAYNREWPISGPEDFLKEFENTEIRTDAEALRVTRGDLECQPRIVVFREP